jgi:fibronectin-binding autotransporter adhesin
MKHKLLAISLLCLALGSASVHAATKYWDIDDLTPGAGGATPSGTWDTGTTANWTTDSTGASAATMWAANDVAIFSAGTDASGAFDVTIPTTVAAGAVTVEEGTISMLTGTLDFGTANGVFDVATNATWNISGAGSGFVGGTGGVTKNGAGVLALGGTMPFSRSSGAVLTINAGIVDFTGDLALGAVPGTARATAVTINGGTLRYSPTTSTTLNALRGVTIGANGGTIEVTSSASIGLSLPSAASFTINGGSSAVLTKTGAGRFTMNTTANTYTGKYIILAGSLNVPGDGRLGTVPASVQADHITMNGSTAGLRIAVTGSTTLNANRGITLGASGGALEQPGPGILTYNGIIAGTGTLKINANDTYGGGTTAGTIILGGANTYSGSTTIATGMTLKLGAAGVIPDTSTVTLSGASTVFNLNGFDETIGSLTSTVASTVALGAKTLTLANGRSTFAGSITGTGGLVKNGTSATPELLSGANTYTGTTTVNAGTLAFSGDSSACTGVTTVNSSGTLSLRAPNALPSSPIVVASGGFLDANNQSPNITALSGSGTVVSNTGTLTVNGALSTGSVFNQYSCFSGTLTNGSLSKSGTHAMALRGSNTFDGTLTFDSGTLSVGVAPNRLPPTIALGLNSPALFQLDANSQAVGSLNGNGNLNLGGGTLTVNETGNSAFSGVIQNSELSGSSTALGHGLRGYYYDNIDMTSLKAVRDDATVNFTDVTSASQLPAEIYSGPSGTNTVSARWLGQVLTTAPGTYNFTTTCDDGRRLWINGQLVVDSWVSGATTKSGTIALAANTKYDLVMEFFNGAGGSSARLLWTPPGDATTNVIPTDYLFLPGPGALVMGGTGTLTLSGANTYSGDTIVAAGTLFAQADGALGNGNVTVSNANLTLQSGATNGYLSTSANLLLNGNAVSGMVTLGFSGSEDIRGLSFDGGATYQPAGTYGSSSSGATHQDDTHFSTSGSGILNVTGIPSANVLTASPSGSVYGSSVNLTSTVTPLGVTGTVTFYDGANWLGAAALNGSGVATLSVSNLQVTASPHSITAVYNGDATHSPRTSSLVSITTTAATLTPNVVVSNKVYDGTNTAIISSATALSGILSADTNYVRLAGTAVATFVDKNVGVGKTVNITGLALTHQ